MAYTLEARLGRRTVLRARAPTEADRDRLAAMLAEDRPRLRLLAGDDFVVSPASPGAP